MRTLLFLIDQIRSTVSFTTAMHSMNPACASYLGLGGTCRAHQHFEASSDFPAPRGILREAS